MSPERFSSVLEAAREGSEAAWQELYEGLAPAVLGYLRANGAPGPEDVLSEVFLQVARDVGHFEGDERGFRSWVVHDRPSSADRCAPPFAPGARSSSHRPTRARGSADDAADEALAGSATEEVSGCSARSRTTSGRCSCCGSIGDLSVEDVAKAVGKRPGAVKALQRRGLAAIKRELARKGVTL